MIDIASSTQHRLTSFVSVTDIARTCGTTDELISKITLSDDDLHQIELHTRGQSQNPHWFRLRKGRITASNFYRIHTRVNTLKKYPNKSCDKLVKYLLDPPSLGHLPQIQRGSALEAEAGNALVNHLTKVGHVNVRIRECGLYIYKSAQFIGASPDGILQCDCCQERLIEIKCPSTAISDLPYLVAKVPSSKELKLKMNHAYYGQVQGQMLVTGINQTIFFVYAGNGIHCETVNTNQMFCKKLLENLELFYTQYLVPKLLCGTSRKRPRQ